MVLAAGATLADVEPQLRRSLRNELSPRHVPDQFIAVDAIPHTLNGKKSEVPSETDPRRRRPRSRRQPGRVVQP